MIPKDAVVFINKPFHFATYEVFDGFTLPELLEKWFFAAGEIPVACASIDFKVGGKFSVTEQRNEVSIVHRGKYVEIEPPLHLAFSLEAPLHFTGVTYVSIFIQPKRYGCELNLTQTGVSPEKMEATWHVMLRQLENVLAETFQEQSFHAAVLAHH